jgi:hypothetical protein
MSSSNLKTVSYSLLFKFLNIECKNIRQVQSLILREETGGSMKCSDIEGWNRQAIEKVKASLDICLDKKRASPIFSMAVATHRLTGKPLMGSTSKNLVFHDP